ncbi:alpha/beta fold hydrolase [uncultured Pseudokineococcus sp.]|uniref:alpha/beta fold hydrolase n=1 Tax=uncultured Pseudokineococcus sp. TaxID=1642928 RepID=UPI002616ABD4|nr:alpha/beta hydrolase [uncultured Pseudokineococcus sp.]
MVSPAGPRAGHDVVTRSGTSVHSWVTGPERGPLVVLSHGATTDSRMFDEQVPALTAAGYRALVWDSRGHGASRPLGRSPITVADMAADLLAVLDSLGERGPVHHVGQSLGTYVAQRIALDSPERVASLVVIGGSSLTLPLPAWQRWGLAASRTAFRWWPERHLRQLSARSTSVVPAVQRYAREAGDQMSRADLLAVWDAVTRALDPRPEHRLEHPLLLLVGEHDRTGTVAREAPRWAALDPRCRYEVVPGAGHTANQDQPEAVNRLLLGFLAEHEPRPTPAEEP